MTPTQQLREAFYAGRAKEKDQITGEELGYLFEGFDDYQKTVRSQALDELVGESERLGLYGPPPPKKTIANLTDEQLLHIANLAYGEREEGINVTVEVDTIWLGKRGWRGARLTIEDTRMRGYKTTENETFRLWGNLNMDFVQDWDGGRGVSNQYQIYEYLRSLNIQPV